MPCLGLLIRVSFEFDNLLLDFMMSFFKSGFFQNEQRGQRSRFITTVTASWFANGRLIRSPGNSPRKGSECSQKSNHQRVRRGSAFPGYC